MAEMTARHACASLHARAPVAVLFYAPFLTRSTLGKSYLYDVITFFLGSVGLLKNLNFARRLYVATT